MVASYCAPYQFGSGRIQGFLILLHVLFCLLPFVILVNIKVIECVVCDYRVFATCTLQKLYQDTLYHRRRGSRKGQKCNDYCFSHKSIFVPRSIERSLRLLSARLNPRQFIISFTLTVYSLDPWLTINLALSNIPAAFILTGASIYFGLTAESASRIAWGKFVQSASSYRFRNRMFGYWYAGFTQLHAPTWSTIECRSGIWGEDPCVRPSHFVLNGFSSISLLQRECHVWRYHSRHQIKSIPGPPNSSVWFTLSCRRNHHRHSIFLL